MPEETARAVRLPEDAGWTNVGETSLYEFAYGVPPQNLHDGTVPNPAQPGPWGATESGAQASVQLVGRPGAGALALAGGQPLEALPARAGAR